jgi:hypothetical protein
MRPAQESASSVSRICQRLRNSHYYPLQDFPGPDTPVSSPYYYLAPQSIRPRECGILVESLP